jgi:hypothetical protein
MKNTRIFATNLRIFTMNDELPLDSVRVSLLTCEPAGQVYEQYGHTAIRYEQPARGYDLVFNYGMFSFNTPHFIWRFVKGETDYQLGIMPYAYFEEEYAERGSSVYQQELNLTAQEKQRLFNLLEENYRPANRTYRYNFFYDNCTTRARDMIERAVEGTIVYTEPQLSDHAENQSVSFRDIVHEHTATTPWTQFGIDLLLGAEADAPISQRQQQFAPFYYRHDVQTAMIQRGGEIQPLMKAEVKVVDAENPYLAGTEEQSVASPFMAALLYLIIYIGVGMYEMRTRRIVWLADIVQYTLQALAGIVIGLLFFCSTHPTVGSNWLILLFNPVPLLVLPWVIYRTQKGKKDLFHRFYAGYLTLFMIFMPVIPQKFAITVVPLALCLLWNAWVHVAVERLKQLNRKK